ncbi:conserved membrane protein of unknown function (plasmid) [Thermococcus nautili]|uniref:FUN14 domain-containing protein n=1 Tax=Thermococcus nautili TaxID=195522 RepID=UPI0025577899|nr:FUN14 domain-containing protein [Thermococcus nautili]CAI1494188.1 conserved membrane protein of unknown function [Thermococcus nautili]
MSYEFNLSGMAGDLTVFGILGFVTGYVMKKLAKLVLALLGAYIMSLYYLQSKGVITINQNALFNLSKQATNFVLTLGQKIIGILPSVGGFTVGFALGFQKG